jgi:hypothetical protein
VCGLVAALGLSVQVRANDDCVDAILIPYASDGQPGWGDLGGRLTLDSTSGSLPEGSVTGCDGVPNTAPGVWFKIVGQGNLTRISTDDAATSFDTSLSVYCSADDSCAGLTCVAANSDIHPVAPVNLRSEVEFCAAIGRTYFILVHGAPSTNPSGAFGLLVEEPRDGMGMRIPCGDVQVCDQSCSFVVPPGAATEQDPLPGGLPAYLDPDIQCNDTLTGTAASGPNLGCSAAPGPLRNFTPLTIGVAMKGDSHAWNGARDVDWYAAVNQMPVNASYIIDYSFQSDGPMEVSPYFAVSSYSNCQISSFPMNLNSTDACGSGFSRRAVLDTRANTTPATGLDGGPNDDLLFRIRNRATQGYNCASGLNNYWIRINWVLAASACPAIPDPPGVLGVDFNDERDEATANTFDGNGGFSGTTYEPCHFTTLTDGIHRGKAGCEAQAPVDGDFIRLTPGVPQIGSIDINVGGTPGGPSVTPGRDIDWYKFELSERSLVHLAVQCGGPAAVFIQENSCDSEATTYAVAGTLGNCGPGPMEMEDQVFLDAGVYIVVVSLTDVFSGGSIFSSIDCRPTSTEYGLSKYRLDLTATPAPPCCAGNADQLSGQVNFDDISAVLANWGAEYGLGATGPGDATCGAGDGVVNFDDINAVLANWLTSCP